MVARYLLGKLCRISCTYSVAGNMLIHTSAKLYLSEVDAAGEQREGTQFDLNSYFMQGADSSDHSAAPIDGWAHQQLTKVQSPAADFTCVHAAA